MYKNAEQAQFVLLLFFIKRDAQLSGDLVETVTKVTSASRSVGKTSIGTC